MRKIRLTGGEPLVRRNIMWLVEQLGRHLRSGALDELTLTTNGSQLERYAERAGAGAACGGSTSRSTRSIRERFRAITRWGKFDKVHGRDRGGARRPASQVKINAVALKGVNEDELDRMVAWCGAEGFDLTLIETMPMGEIDGDRTEQYLPLSLVRARLAERWTLDRHRLPDRRAGALRAGRGDRRPARLHHAADPQFLRELQPRAGDLHRHACTCAWARRTPPTCAAPLRASEGDEPLQAAILRRHRAQAQGPRLHHRPPPASGRRSAGT